MKRAKRVGLVLMLSACTTPPPPNTCTPPTGWEGRWLGEVFLSHYKYDAFVFFTSVRLRGDVVEDELLMADDKPVVPQGVQSLPAKLLQRVEFKRVVDCPK